MSSCNPEDEFALNMGTMLALTLKSPVQETNTKEHVNQQWRNVLKVLHVGPSYLSKNIPVGSYRHGFPALLD